MGGFDSLLDPNTGSHLSGNLQGGDNPERQVVNCEGLQAATQKIQDRFCNLPVIQNRGSSRILGRWQQVRRNFPVRVRQIAGQKQVPSGILPSVDIGPRASLRCSHESTAEARVTDVKNRIFRSASAGET